MVRHFLPCLGYFAQFYTCYCNFAISLMRFLHNKGAIAIFISLQPHSFSQPLWAGLFSFCYFFGRRRAHYAPETRRSSLTYSALTYSALKYEFSIPQEPGVKKVENCRLHKFCSYIKFESQSPQAIFTFIWGQLVKIPALYCLQKGCNGKRCSLRYLLLY